MGTDIRVFKKIEIFDVKNKCTNEKYLAAMGFDIIRNLNSEEKATIFGKKISYTGKAKSGGYVPSMKRYFSFLKIYVIGNKNFTSEDAILYKDGEISVFSLEEYSEKFERCFGSTDIKISNKGFIQVKENLYINLNTSNDVTLGKDDVIISYGTSLLHLTREETEYFDKIKEVIEKYIKE